MFNKVVVLAVLFSALTIWSRVAPGDTLATIADASLSENGADSIPTPATNEGNGTSPNSINVRWNFGSNMDRNDWGAFKFDLSSIEDKSTVQAVTFNAYMHRESTNNANRNLHLYAITPGTEGEDWPEETIIYGDMPGFTWDDNATTNVLAVGPGMALTDLGSFNTPAELEPEGSLATVTPLLSGSDVLTQVVQGMGSNNLLTLLFTYQTSSNGTWNMMTRESTQSSTGVLSGDPGDFAAYLEFDIGSACSLEGDFNCSGAVENADLTLLLNNWAAAVPPVPAGWTGTPQPTGPAIDNDELTALLNNWGSSVGSGSESKAVPEPASAAMILLGIATSMGTLRSSKKSGR